MKLPSNGSPPLASAPRGRERRGPCAGRCSFGTRHPSPVVPHLTGRAQKIKQPCRTWPAQRGPLWPPTRARRPSPRAPRPGGAHPPPRGGPRDTPLSSPPLQSRFRSPPPTRRRFGSRPRQPHRPGPLNPTRHAPPLPRPAAGGARRRQAPCFAFCVGPGARPPAGGRAASWPPDARKKTGAQGAGPGPAGGRAGPAQSPLVSPSLSLSFPQAWRFFPRYPPPKLLARSCAPCAPRSSFTPHSFPPLFSSSDGGA
jgi:hypothetical protein